MVIKKHNSELCCICNQKLSERAKSPLWLLGNNPYPVVNDAPDFHARACDVCNELEVFPARLKASKNLGDYFRGGWNK